jgi:hypothetical protein
MANPITIAAVVCGVALAAWAGFTPAPYGFCMFVMAFVPIAAAGWALSSGGGFGFLARRGDARPNLDGLILMPIIGLLVRGLQDLHIVDWAPAAAASAVIGAALAAAGFLAGAQGSGGFGRSLALLVLGGGWGWGVLVQLDSGIDLSPATPEAVSVLGTHISRGRTTSYELTLAPWGERTGPQTVSVPYRLFKDTQTGGLVCVTPHPGAFHIRWFALKAC